MTEQTAAGWQEGSIAGRGVGDCLRSLSAAANRLEHGECGRVALACIHPVATVSPPTITPTLFKPSTGVLLPHLPGVQLATPAIAAAATGPDGV